MRALEIITGHVIYNSAYTYKFQMKTTIDPEKVKITVFLNRFQAKQSEFIQVLEMELWTILITTLMPARKSWLTLLLTLVLM